jgi:hypothetical protein
MLNFGSKPYVSPSQTRSPAASALPRLSGLHWVRALGLATLQAALLNGCSGDAGANEQGNPSTTQKSEALLQTRELAVPNTADDQSFQIEGATPDRTQSSGTEGQTLAKAETFTCKLTCTDNGWTCGNDCFGSEGTWCWSENHWQGGHWGGWSAYVCVSASGDTTYH